MAPDGSLQEQPDGLRRAALPEEIAVVLSPATACLVPRPAVSAARHLPLRSLRVMRPARTVLRLDGVLALAGPEEGALCRTARGDWLDLLPPAARPPSRPPRAAPAPAGTVVEAIAGWAGRYPGWTAFLTDCLPRILLAAAAAPAGTPVLVDAGLAPEARAALALCLPGHPLHDLAPGAAVAVGRLHAAEAGRLADLTLAPDDLARPLVRLRAAAGQGGAGQAGAGQGRAAGPRILLWPPAGPAHLRNAVALRAALEARGCVTLVSGTMDLADRIAALSAAEVVVLADPDCLGDALLAPAGARLFPLLPTGAALHPWSLVGEAGGQPVTPVLGSAPYRRLRHRLLPARLLPRAPRVFHVDPYLILPFLPDPAPPAPDLPARALLDLLYGAGFEADVLTGAWAVSAGPTPAWFEARLRRLRGMAAARLLAADAAEVGALFDHPFFTDFARNLRSGFPVLGAFSAAEAALAERVRAGFAALAGEEGAGPRGGAEAAAGAARGVDAGPDGGQDGAPDPAFAGPAGARRLVMLGMLLLPAWQVPLPGAAALAGAGNGAGDGAGDGGDAAGSGLPEAVLERWIAWAMAPPALIRAGEDAAWVAHVARLLDWLADRLDPQAGGLSPALALRLARLAGRIDLGQLLLVDAPLRAVQAARNRVLDRVALRDGPVPAGAGQGAGPPPTGRSSAPLALRLREGLTFAAGRLRLHLAAARRTGQLRPLLAAMVRRGLGTVRGRTPRLRDGPVPAGAVPAVARDGRIRLGVLCRTFDKGPDSEAIVTALAGFDRSRYTLFAYSIGFRDRVVSKDPAFDRILAATVDHRRDLPADPAGIRAALRADRLDIFLYANATTYGLQPLDLALYHRIAPLQIVLNSHVPMPMGYPAFDAVITGLSDDPAREVPQSDYAERLIRLPGPVINYLTTLEPRPDPPLDRQALGLAPDDIVLMNAGSSMKLRHHTLATMMRAVRDIPRGILLLAPYNPGWAARSMAFVFNRQIAETAAETGLDPDRIRVLGELSVAEAEAALGCADLYLNPFPHGGATMTHLALVHGIPPVTLRRRSTRSIDQFLVASHGFAELLADTPEDYIALATALGTDHERRAALRARLRAATEGGKRPAFVSNPDHSAALQAAIDQAWAERAGTERAAADQTGQGT